MVYVIQKSQKKPFRARTVYLFLRLLDSNNENGEGEGIEIKMRMGGKIWRGRVEIRNEDEVGGG